MDVHVSYQYGTGRTNEEKRRNLKSLDRLKKHLPVILFSTVFVGVWVFSLWGNPIFADQSSEGVKYVVEMFDGVSMADAVATNP